MRSRTLWTACAAHALHDGYTDVIYLMLPVWQTDFGLGYGVLALLRGLTAGTLAGLQVPVGRIAERIGGCAILALGTVVAALGYALAGFSSGLFGLCAALIVAACGLSTQHPIASSAVSRAYGRDARGPLGTYNFAGDLGKAAIPSGTSVLLTLMPWHEALWVVSAIGLVVAAGVAVFLPSIPPSVSAAVQAEDQPAAGRGGFSLLLTIGVLDSGVRMGFLTFLPFLLTAEGASVSTVGSALAMVFIGGAAGKFACGWLGARFGMVSTVLLTEAGTALGILAVLVLPLFPTFVVLPFLGVMLNGTSSVLYGTVPDLAPASHTQRAFAIFYTGTIGAGAIAPILYGVLGDAAGPQWATIATAVTAAMILPLAIMMAPRLSAQMEPE